MTLIEYLPTQGASFSDEGAGLESAAAGATTKQMNAS
jgi:hypothetical protein